MKNIKIYVLALLILSLAACKSVDNSNNNQLGETQESKLVEEKSELEKICFFRDIEEDVKSEKKFSNNQEISLELEFEDASLFPKDLVMEIAEIVQECYSTANYEVYEEMVKKYSGAESMITLDNYQTLFPEYENVPYENIDDFFRDYYNTEYVYLTLYTLDITSDNRIFLAQMSGNGTGGIVEYEKIVQKGDEFEVCGRFETYSSTMCSVIQYQDQMYYIYWLHDQNMVNLNGIEIVSLGEELKKMQVKVIPHDIKQYEIRRDDTLFLQGVENYFTERNLNWDDYLIWSKDHGIEFLDGNKETCINDYYSIRLWNDDRTVFYQKKMNYYEWNPISVSINFFALNETNYVNITDNFVPKKYEPIQTWFEQINGKNVSFVIYHTDDYDYILDVFYYEGNEKREIAVYALIPDITIETFCDVMLGVG